MLREYSADRFADRREELVNQILTSSAKPFSQMIENNLENRSKATYSGDRFLR